MQPPAAVQEQVACARCNTLNRIAGEKPSALARCGKCRSVLLPGLPLELTGENFQAQVERSTVPILVDFWAPWCAPCRMMAPVLEQTAQRFAGVLRVGKLNTEDQPRVGAWYGVRGIPTLVLFQHGTEIARHVGAIDFRALAAWIDSTLRHSAA